MAVVNYGTEVTENMMQLRISSKSISKQIALLVVRNQRRMMTLLVSDEHNLVRYSTERYLYANWFKLPQKLNPLMVLSSGWKAAPPTVSQSNSLLPSFIVF